MAIDNDSYKIYNSKEIDKQRWDELVLLSYANIYCYSWYLDTIAEDWDAIIDTDYKIAIPLPKKKKWGFHFYYMPIFLPSISVIERNTDPKERNAILQYLYTNINLALLRFDLNIPLQQKQSTSIVAKANYTLSLDKPYEEIEKEYSAECKKNIRKAKSRYCNLIDDVTVDTVIQFYRNAYGTLNKANDSDYLQLKNILELAWQKEHCQCYGINDDAGNLVFAAALLQDAHKLYYIIGAPNEAGRRMRSTYYFIDQIIEQYAGTRIILDFEGSDIPNVAHFYQSFTPMKEIHTFVRINKLIPPLRQLLNARWHL